MALLIRISLNHPLKSSRNHTAIETWVAATTDIAWLIPTQANHLPLVHIPCLFSFYAHNFTALWPVIITTCVQQIHFWTPASACEPQMHCTLHNCVDWANISSDHLSYVQGSHDLLSGTLVFWDSCGIHVWVQPCLWVLKYNMYYFPQLLNCIATEFPRMNWHKRCKRGKKITVR